MPISALEERFFSQLQDMQDEKPVVEEGPEDSPSPVQRRGDYAPFAAHNFLAHHDTHPLVLDTMLLDRYGADWLDWEPQTIVTELKEDFRQPSISALNWQQIQAVKTCHLTPAPWRAWDGFVVVCAALNNNIPNFRTLVKPTIAQVMVALDIMSRIDDHLFSEEMAQFLAACFLDEGVYFLPTPVDFAQSWATNPRYRCTKCGKVDRDNENTVCDSCGAPDDYLEKEYERDWRPIKDRYDQIVSEGDDHEELQETVEDVQVAKLLVARDYVTYRQQQLAEQLKVVRDARLP
jgi:hypothetical protein